MTDNNKNVCTYIIWGITALLSVVMLFMCAVCMAMMTGIIRPESTQSFASLSGVIAVGIVTLGIVALLGVLAFRIPKVNRYYREKIRADFTVISFMFLFLIFIFIRMVLNLDVFNSDLFGGTVSRAYSMALIGVDGVYVSFNSIKDICLTYFSLFFLIFGNNSFAIFAGEIVLLSLSFVFLFYAITILAGKVEALISMSLLCIDVFVLNGLSSDSVYLVELLLFSFTLFVTALLSYLLRSEKLSIIFVVISTGLSCLLFLYDYIAFALFGLILGLIIQSKQKLWIRICEGLFTFAGSAAMWFYIGVKPVFTDFNIYFFVCNIYTLIGLILAVAYVMMYPVNKRDNSIGFALMFILMTVGMVMLPVNDCLICLIVGHILLFVLDAIAVDKMINNGYGVENIGSVLKKNIGGTDKADSMIKTDDVTKEDDVPIDDDVPEFNMASLDWSKLAEARLIDYPDPNEDKNTEDTKSAEPVCSETDVEKCRPDNTDRNVSKTETEEKEKTAVRDYGFDGYDYDISPEDMHYDY